MKQGSFHHRATLAPTVLLVSTASKLYHHHACLVWLGRGPIRVRHLQRAKFVNQEKAIRTTIRLLSVLHAHQDATTTLLEALAAQAAHLDLARTQATAQTGHRALLIRAVLGRHVFRAHLASILQVAKSVPTVLKVRMTTTPHQRRLASRAV